MRSESIPLPAAVAGFAANRHGIVDAAELNAIGVNGDTILRWARAGRIHRLYPSVYSVIPPSMLSQRARWCAAVKSCGLRAFLSHGPSGQIHGIVSRSMRYALDVSLVGRSPRKPAGVLVHRPRTLDPIDTTIRFGIPTTTATRAIWDMAFTHSRQPVRKAFERGERLDRVSRARLAALAAAHPNRKGSGLIRRLLAERPLPAAEVRSWLEELVWETCTSNGLPLPAVNVPLLGYTIDFLWESARFVVEADGGDHLEQTQRDQDNRRDFDLQRAGFLVRRYSTRDMSREREVVAEVLRILNERSG